MSDYPVHALARITRLTDRQLVDQLFAIGAPQSLVGLRYAVGTIIQILDRGASHEDLRGVIGEAEWRTLHDDLRAAADLPADLLKVPDRDKGYPRWMHRQVTQHPLYAALVSPSVRALTVAPDGVSICTILLAYGGMAYRSFGSRDDYARSLTHDAEVEWIGSEYRSSIAAAGLALRTSHLETAAQCWLPDPAMPPYEYRFRTRLADEKYVRSKTDNEVSAADEMSHRVAHLVQIACGLKSPRSVDRPINDWSLETEREPSTEGGLTTDRQSSDEHGVVSTYVMQVAPATKADADVPAPERPVSYRTTITVIDVSKDTDGDLAHADAEGYRRSLAADSVETQLAKSHMDLCTAPALPTAREQADLAALLSFGSDALSADARRLACVIHATGRSDAQCLAAMYALSTEEPESDIEYLLDLRCWRIRIPAPAYEDASLWDISVCRPWQGFALLPDLVRAADRLGQENPVTLQGKRIVQYGKQSLRQLNKHLREHRSGPRKLRSEWIRKSTRRRLHAACNDDLPPALIHGGRRRNTETTIHYSSPDARHVESVYRNAFGAANCDSAMLNPAGVHVGSKLCPTDDFIRNWIRQAKSILRRTRRRDLITCHRIYVRYVALMVIHACALRATKDPHPDLVDPELLIAIIDDKSRRPGQSTRIQVLPAVVIELLNHYELHRLDVLREFGDLDKSPQDYPYFFDLRDGQIVELAPKHFRESIEGLSFPLPPSSMRRHMRTRLLECGEDAQSIDPTLSHWQRATSPQARHSTFPWLAGVTTR